MKHHVYLYDRGGRNRIDELTDLSLVRWDRVRDDISASNIVVSNPGQQCSKTLAAIEPGRHELVVFRGTRRVWEGPITLLTYDKYSVTVEAKDPWHYTYRTIMRSAHDNAYPNVTSAIQRIKGIMESEMVRMERLDPPINVMPFFTPIDMEGSARTSRSTMRYESTVWEEVDDMAAKGGIDYTAVGRSLLVWDTHMPLSTSRMLTEEDFTNDVHVTSYGMELATYAAVTDGRGRWGSAGGTDDYYGLWEVLDTAYQDQDVTDEDFQEIPKAELVAQAARNLTGRNPTPVVVRIPDNSSLTPKAVEELIDFLVPGVFFPLRSTSTVRRIEQMQKLDNLRFEETPDGETVSVTLSPAPGQSVLGNDDAGEEVEE